MGHIQIKMARRTLMAQKQTQNSKIWDSLGLCIGCVYVDIMSVCVCVCVCVYVLGRGSYLLVVKIDKKSEEIQDI